MDSQELGSGVSCSPKPFAYRDLPHLSAGYPVMVDAGITGFRAKQILALLVHGRFVDAWSKRVTVQVTSPPVRLDFVSRDCPSLEAKANGSGVDLMASARPLASVGRVEFCRVWVA